MLEKRIIPALLLSNSGLVKTVKFKDPKYIGDPINTVRIFNNKEADELIIIDIDASKSNRGPNFDLLEQIASEAFMPLGYAGGIRTLDQMEKVFALGYEKVALSSGVFTRPEMISEAAKLFGSQSVVGIVDVDKGLLGGKKAINHLNHKQSLSPLEHALKLQDLGVGEIILHFIYKEGTFSGYDLELIREISQKISVPLVALGGASSKDDLSLALKAGADAAAAGSLFIYHGPHKAVLVNYPKRNEIEAILAEREVSVSSYQMCSRCVMDTTDPNITFDNQGVCNHCHAYEELKKNWPLKKYIAEKEIEKVFTSIKEKQKSKRYDCIIGLSGGVDSSYIAWLAAQHGLRPLCVHLDNGWNSELATHNIHSIVEKLGFDLVTHVIDWEEFRELQRAFFKADVIDIEVLSDHAIFGVIIELAKKHGIKYMLSGANNATEAILPKAWVHRKQDLINIKDIFKKYGQGKMKSFPQVSTLKHVFLMYGMGYKVIKPLNMIDYNKDAAKKLLMEKLDWRDYGGKHYESVFTKFYQAHILPTKFNVDKRKAHLSTLINSGQLSREEALIELKKPLYDPKELKEDTEFVLKKLNFSQEWFKEYLNRKPVSHYAFKSDQWIYDILNNVKQRIS